MELEWDAEKSAKLQAERGASFEGLDDSLKTGGLLDVLPHPALEYAGQELWVVRHQGDVWAVIAEKRGRRYRLVTAYRSRKLRKIYEKR